MNEQTNVLLSEQQVMDFFIVVLKDKALLSRLVAALDTKDGDAMISMASECGYSLDQQSLDQGLKKVLNLVAPLALVESSDISE